MNRRQDIADDAHEFVLDHTIPFWFENHSTIRLTAVALAILVYLAQRNIGETFPLPLTSVVMAVTGMSLDHYGTWQAHLIKPEFDKRGLKMPFYEANERFPLHPTLKDLTLHWFAILKLAIIIPVALVLPPFGFAIGYAYACHGINNFRGKYLAQLTLKLFDTKIKNPSVKWLSEYLSSL